MSSPTRILVLAHRTAATPKLLEQVRRRAHHGQCSFVLLVPRRYWDPETEEVAKVIEVALPLLGQAAGARVEAMVDTDPFIAVQVTLERRPSNEVIISRCPNRVSHWLRLELPALWSGWGAGDDCHGGAVGSSVGSLIVGQRDVHRRDRPGQTRRGSLSASRLTIPEMHLRFPGTGASGGTPGRAAAGPPAGARARR
jgi:hypothetical protein